MGILWRAFGSDSVLLSTWIDRPMKHFLYFIGRSISVYGSALSKPKRLPQYPHYRSAHLNGAVRNTISEKVRTREAEARERRVWRSPAVCAKRMGRRGFKVTEMGLRFRASKARKPISSGGFLRNLLRRGGSLRLFLSQAFLSEDKKA